MSDHTLAPLDGEIEKQSDGSLEPVSNENTIVLGDRCSLYLDPDRALSGLLLHVITENVSDSIMSSVSRDPPKHAWSDR